MANFDVQNDLNQITIQMNGNQGNLRMGGNNTDVDILLFRTDGDRTIDDTRPSMRYDPRCLDAQWTPLAPETKALRSGSSRVVAVAHCAFGARYFR